MKTANPFYDHPVLPHLIQSYETLLNQPFLEASSVMSAETLYHAPFVLLAHDAEKDPLFIYANLTAQTLFEMDWPTFTQLPSRLSAGECDRAERQHLLNTVEKQGYIDDYQGIRVSKTGRRFWIEGAVVWNIYNAKNQYLGQAARFSTWKFL